MVHRLACATVLAALVAIAAPRGVSATGDGGEDSSRERDAQQESESESSDEEENSEEGMTEEERQAWKNRKRRAAQIAIRDAAGPEGWLVQTWTWDLSFDVGLRLLGDTSGWTFQGRTGITRIQEPGAYSAGVTGQIDTDGHPVVGLEAEVLSLNLGTFARVGGGLGMVDGTARWSAGVGWHVLGVEAAYEPSAPRGARWTGIAELRLPASWILRAVTGTDEGG